MYGNVIERLLFIWYKSKQILAWHGFLRLTVLKVSSSPQKNAHTCKMHMILQSVISSYPFTAEIQIDKETICEKTKVPKTIPLENNEQHWTGVRGRPTTSI